MPVGFSVRHAAPPAYPTTNNPLTPVGVGGVDVVLVGRDHVPAGLLEPAREPARAGEQVDPDRLPVGVLDDRPPAVRR